MGKDPDILVTLTSAKDPFEADVIVQALEAKGIAARAFSTAASTLTWEVAMTDPIKVQVRRADLPLARAALQDMRLDSTEIDWDDVDVGENLGPEGGEAHPEDADGASLRFRTIVVLFIVAAAFVMLVLALGGYGEPGAPRTP